MIYVNPFSDLMTSNGSNQSANKLILANSLAQSNQAFTQVRSASTSSSLSTVSSASTSPQMTSNQITTKSTELINNQLLAKNLPIQTSIYPAYPTNAYAYLYTQPSRLIQNSANFATTLTNLSAQSNSMLQSSNPLTYLSNADCSYILDQSTLLPTTSYIAPTFTDISIGASLAKSAFGSNHFKKNRKKFKKPPELRRVLPKNSLMLLHELRQNVEYRFVSQSGPIHRPIFTMCVDIDEHKFEGSGKTKKLARMQAAEKAVQFLMSHPELIQKPKSKSDEDQNQSNSESNAVCQDEGDSNDSHRNVKKLKTQEQDYNC
ncbi:double-stranded RNA-specific editase 1 [Brachionus plicatilis]|uniref:Double-stranded RNA-specific editase 1 n=1 Tax=Brachionus plicatilis TaxID=10195 RepID=A0A3M7S6M8_BRAPC|nr:double-stranded RNA-specific editase 1 [Brachionus plicatilis]